MTHLSSEILSDLVAYHTHLTIDPDWSVASKCERQIVARCIKALSAARDGALGIFDEIVAELERGDTDAALATAKAAAEVYRDHAARISS